MEYMNNYAESCSVYLIKRYAPDLAQSERLWECGSVKLSQSVGVPLVEIQEQPTSAGDAAVIYNKQSMTSGGDIPKHCISLCLPTQIIINVFIVRCVL